MRAKYEGVRTLREGVSECVVTRKVRIETLTGECRNGHRYCSPDCDNLVEQYRNAGGADWCFLFDMYLDCRQHPDDDEFVMVRCTKCRKVFGEMKRNLEGRYDVNKSEHTP